MVMAKSEQLIPILHTLGYKSINENDKTFKDYVKEHKEVILYFDGKVRRYFVI